MTEKCDKRYPTTTPDGRIQYHCSNDAAVVCARCGDFLCAKHAAVHMSCNSSYPREYHSATYLARQAGLKTINGEA